MKIIKPYVEIISEIDSNEVLRDIEMYARTCYQSLDKMKQDMDSTKQFVHNIITRGHESVLEHRTVSVRFVVSRAIANEITRHRICSHSQESTRYVKYDSIEFIEPRLLDTEPYMRWREVMEFSEIAYKRMIKCGCKPEIARTVLPLSTKTELITTANLREWRHFLKLRCNQAADPEMRRVTIPLLGQFVEMIPVVFDDIEV